MFENILIYLDFFFGEYIVFFFILIKVIIVVFGIF